MTSYIQMTYLTEAAACEIASSSRRVLLTNSPAPSAKMEIKMLFF